MAATNRYMNATAAFTPSGGSSTPLSGLKTAAYDEGISLQKESGDGDLFVTVLVNDHLDPTVTLSVLDAFAIYSQLAATIGSLALTVFDSKNKTTAAGGGKLVTMSNAQLMTRSQSHAHRQISTGSLAFCAASSDGQTHPVAITAL